MLIKMEQSLANERDEHARIVEASDNKTRDDFAGEIDRLRGELNSHTAEASQRLKSLDAEPSVSLAQLHETRDALKAEVQTLLAEVSTQFGKLDARLQPLEAATPAVSRLRRQVGHSGASGLVPSSGIDLIATALGTKKAMQISDVVTYNGTGTLTNHRNSLEDYRLSNKLPLLLI